MKPRERRKLWRERRRLLKELDYWHSEWKYNDPFFVGRFVSERRRAEVQHAESEAKSRVENIEALLGTQPTESEER